MSAAPSFVIRAAGPNDLPAVLRLKELAGPGFTSLAAHPDVLAKRLELSARSYADSPTGPGPERYTLALESLEDGTVCGLAAVKACVGAVPPFFNFRVFKVAQASAVAERRFDMDVLILVNEFSNCTEVGSLFLESGRRQGGVGRALAQARYMLMAAEPHRFADVVVSELRGVVGADGRSPFWEALGRQFFRMDFDEADRLSATTDNQFILDLMPRYPIYADLLPAEARAVIGVCHPDGVGARRLLEWEGFYFSNVVDVFDAGPLLSCPRDTIRTRREARRLPLVRDERAGTASRALIATPTVADFRCVPVRCQVTPEAALVSGATLEALRLDSGSEALVWAETHAI